MKTGSPSDCLTGYGYVSLPDGMYHYYLKDHQGNNRVVADRNGKVEEVNHYYPFGGMFAHNGNVQPYKYNGKELDTRKELNWYDYGARHYDPAVEDLSHQTLYLKKIILPLLIYIVEVTLSTELIRTEKIGKRYGMQPVYHLV